MKNAVLVVMVVFLAVIMLPLTVFAYDPCAPPNSPNSIEYARKAEVMNREAQREDSRRYDYSSRLGNSGYGNRSRNDNYGYSRSNSNRTGINVGLDTRIGGVRINLGYNKTTYSRPKPQCQPQPKVIVVNQPVVVAQKPASDKYRLTLVREVGDQLETISDIIVTNPEKELVPGKRIVFNRAGEFFAEYEVSRVSGETVFVKVIDAPRGKPRQGDTFIIDPEQDPVNTAD